MNIFEEKYPEFIQTDNRQLRHRPGIDYIITAEASGVKHQLILPASVVAGKSVLDLGCCVGATGAWVLEHGASRYVGVELQPKYATLAKQNLGKYFFDKNWEILEVGFEHFFRTNIEKFDIVVACGVIYTSLHYQRFIENVVAIARKMVIIESAHPRILTIDGLQNDTYQIGVSPTRYLPVTQYSRDAPMTHEGSFSVSITACFPSIGALQIIFEEYGFVSDLSCYDKLVQRRSSIFNDHGRFIVIFNRAGVQKQKDFETIFANKDEQKIFPWRSTPYTKEEVEEAKASWPKFTIKPTEVLPWEFNSSVASDFTNYARKHIPDYDKVIEISIDVCEVFSTNRAESKIVDIGCATGETLDRLGEAGFTNLLGIDASKEMLNKCSTKSGAVLIHSSSFPENQDVDIVLCNWTLHFINEKINYLKQIYNSLSPGGCLVLTDKTANSGFDLTMYHNFKRNNGVSEVEILQKAESLKGVMFIDPPEWYLSTLSTIGFKTVTVINATYCFTTFLGIK